MASRISLGLERITHLLCRLDNPHKCYNVIHVAGTNGKGSVSAMIANTLNRAGLRTGLYTSPHLVHRWDGIRIGDQSINHAEFCALERQVKEEAQALRHTMNNSQSKNDFVVSTFEQMTATAFAAFREAEVEVAVIEVGLGGEHDATNVVDPVLSVITAIGIDHTDFLGKTVQDIARAKGGIIKAGVPVVVSSDQEYGEVYGVLGSIQRKVNPGHKILWTPPNSTLDFRISNRNTARAALQCLRDDPSSKIRQRLVGLSDEIIEEGLMSTHWPGRCEHVDLRPISGPVSALIDGAHNQQSIDALGAVLAELPLKSRAFIVAMTAGKDASHISKLLRPGDSFFTVEFERVDDMEWIRPMSSGHLFGSIMEHSSGVHGIDCGMDVAKAISLASRSADGHELVICGSLYLVGQVFRMLESAKHEQQHYPVSPRGSLPAYDTSQVESKVQRYWANLPAQNPAANTRTKGVMNFLLPPPNVTGSLHIGHALTLAMEDAYCRYFHCEGYHVNWVPGTDHAGIATQSVVSKQLAKRGIITNDLSRFDFISHIWTWKEHYGTIIRSQLQRLGTSLDWSSEYFTLDETRKNAVMEAFKRLWQAGLLKRENRMVNWSIGLQSVISDIEVEHQTIDGPTKFRDVEFGKMWRIRFEVLDEAHSQEAQQFIEVDTTRPETIFGDRALAVHPEDKRFLHLVGKQVRHPLLADVLLDIVADTRVKMEFGTGCVKLTPAHDDADYHICLSHPKIPLVSVFGKDGKLFPIPEYPDVCGIDRLKARELVVKHLLTRNALIMESSHKTTIPICSRSGAVIEPLLLPQWYISTKSLADEVLARDDIKMSNNVRRDWKRWLENVQDWCISRQLIWGHQIPLYKVLDAAGSEETWVYGVDEQDAIEHAGGRRVVQDSDVLDTWFSSALLPLSAFGWPTRELEPGHTLEFIESGSDILFFWLARMAMLCTFLHGAAPFKEIVLHPLICDAQGRKMSKSLGNVIDPMSLIEGQDLPSMIEILRAGNLEPTEMVKATKELRETYPQGIRPYGADALRFALIQSTVQREVLKFDLRNVVAARYLCTKLWNAVNFYKFNTAKIKTMTSSTGRPSHEGLGLFGSWIVLELNRVRTVYDSGFMNREVHRSTDCVRYFLVDQVCDVYLEFLKTDLQEVTSQHAATSQLEILKSVLDRILQMLAPFMPHITEELWHAIGNAGSIHRQARLPEMSGLDSALSDAGPRVEFIAAVLHSLRNIPQRQSSQVTLHSSGQFDNIDNLQRYLPHLKRLADLKDLRMGTIGNVPSNASPILVNLSYTCVMHDIKPVVKEPTTAENRMRKKLLSLLELTSNVDYAARVPAAVKEKHHSEIQELKHKLKID